MSKLRRRRKILFLFTGIIVIGVGAFLARDVLFFTFAYKGTRADWALMQAVRELSLSPAPETEALVREQALSIARENPGTRTEIAAYLVVACRWIESEEARMAMARLLPAAENLDIADWAAALNVSRSGYPDVERRRPLALRLMERVRRQPEHPAAARLLCEIAVFLRPDSSADSSPPELLQIADLISKNYATSPDLANFCEVAGDQGSSASYTRPFEPHIRHILDVNQDRFVRCSAQFALASIVRAGGAARQDEARQLYENFLATYDGETVYHAQSVEKLCRQWAEQALDIIRSHGTGMSAPDTHGSDLAGNSLSLADYHGRVVLVSIWASWCPPCLRMIPHERAMLESFGQTDFAIFGINEDDELDRAQAAAEKHGITWPSLRKSSHSKDWKVYGYPTFYLLDRDGVVRHYWLGEPPVTELEDTIRNLIHPEGRAPVQPARRPVLQLP